MTLKTHKVKILIKILYNIIRQTKKTKMMIIIILKINKKMK